MAGRAVSLPFADLLDVLRAQGLAIGPDDHLRVARLLDRYDGASRDDLRGALAALLARDADEVEQVRAAFDLLYPPASAPSAVDVAPSTPATGRRWPWAVGAGLLIAAGVAVVLVARPSAPPELAPATGPAAAPARPPDTLRWTTDPCDPPTRDDATQAALLALGAALLLGVSSRRRGGRVAAPGRRGGGARPWTRCPRPAGTTSTSPPPRRRPSRAPTWTTPPPGWLRAPDGAARRAGRRAHARGDRRGGRRARAPRFRPRPAPAAVLLLHDTGAAMAPWRAHVDALLAGLRTRGVHVEVARFVDRPTSWSSTARRFRWRRWPSGRGTCRCWAWGPARPSSCPPCAASPAAAWLNPVPDPAWWAPGFAAAEVPAWPLTRGGLLAAAQHLVGTRRRRRRAARPQCGGATSSACGSCAACCPGPTARRRWPWRAPSRRTRAPPPSSRWPPIRRATTGAAAERWLRDHEGRAGAPPGPPAARAARRDGRGAARARRQRGRPALAARSRAARAAAGRRPARARGQAELDALAATPLGRDVAEASGLAAPDATVLGDGGGRPVGFGWPSWGAALAAAALTGLAWWSASSRTLLQDHVVLSSRPSIHRPAAPGCARRPASGRPCRRPTCGCTGPASTAS
ncbi:MAG: hypothetical protein H6704_11500 [Myxococcales bacterium]|nr:hypothetical protein [Myxococcales bacterium]